MKLSKIALILSIVIIGFTIINGCKKNTMDNMEEKIEENVITLVDSFSLVISREYFRQQSTRGIILQNEMGDIVYQISYDTPIPSDDLIIKLKKKEGERFDLTIINERVSPKNVDYRRFEIMTHYDLSNNSTINKFLSRDSPETLSVNISRDDNTELFINGVYSLEDLKIFQPRDRRIEYELKDVGLSISYPKYEEVFSSVILKANSEKNYRIYDNQQRKDVDSIFLEDLKIITLDSLNIKLPSKATWIGSIIANTNENSNYHWLYNIYNTPYLQNEPLRDNILILKPRNLTFSDYIVKITHLHQKKTTFQGKWKELPESFGISDFEVDYKIITKDSLLIITDMPNIFFSCEFEYESDMPGYRSNWLFTGKSSSNGEISIKVPTFSNEVLQDIISFVNHPIPKLVKIELLKPWKNNNIEDPENPFEITTKTWRIENSFKIRRKFIVL